MLLEWSDKGYADLEGIHEFWKEKSVRVANETLLTLEKAPLNLLRFPRMGKQRETYDTREVRYIIKKNYYIYYEILNDKIFYA